MAASDYLKTISLISIPVSKRSAEPLPDSGKYAEFMGKGVIEYDLANIAEVEAYEQQQK